VISAKHRPRSVVYTAGQPGARPTSPRVRVGTDALRLALDQLEQRLRPVLFFPLDEKAEIDAGTVCRLDRLEQTEDLPLVVRGTARVEPTVSHGGFKRRRRPLGQRIRRLHVVMPVDQQCGRAGHFRSPAPHHWMRFTAKELDTFTPQTTQLGRNPVRGCAAIIVVY
jgi:hypothetical protein